MKQPPMDANGGEFGGKAPNGWWSPDSRSFAVKNGPVPIWLMETEILQKLDASLAHEPG